MSISVLTIVRGRQTHLENQLKGLLQSQVMPAQWIVVGMDQEVSVPMTDRLPVRTDRVNGDGESLPLAKARNRAAAICKTEQMIFLDVDCIPSPTMIGTFQAALTDDERLWMGNAKYLPADATSDRWFLDDLASVAVDHPLQPKLESGHRRPSDQYEMFWSLCFAITQAMFDRIGGFDETFGGYGGEDTDFAFTARQAGVPFGFLGATAFHQHHVVCQPPLNHFHEILSNASHFHQKWNVWPMLSWLDAFQSAGLVEYDPRADQWRVLREPSDDEIRSAQTLTPPNSETGCTERAGDKKCRTAER